VYSITLFKPPLQQGSQLYDEMHPSTNFVAFLNLSNRSCSRENTVTTIQQRGPVIGVLEVISIFRHQWLQNTKDMPLKESFRH